MLSFRINARKSDLPPILINNEILKRMKKIPSPDITAVKNFDFDQHYRVIV